MGVNDGIQEKEKFRAARNAYNEETARLKKLFKDDLEAEHGVTGNSKADKCFNLAWEHGHSAGLSEVASHYDDFVELIRGSR